MVNDKTTPLRSLLPRMVSRVGEPAAREKLTMLDERFAEVFDAALRRAHQLDAGDVAGRRSGLIVVAVFATALPAVFVAFGQWRTEYQSVVPFLVASAVFTAVAVRAYDEHRIGYALANSAQAAALRRTAYEALARWDSLLLEHFQGDTAVELSAGLNQLLLEFRRAVTSIAHDLGEASIAGGGPLPDGRGPDGARSRQSPQ